MSAIMPATSDAYGLVIGIANYQALNRLPAAVLNDARALRDALVDPALCAYPTDHVTLLLDNAATLDALRRSR